MTIEIKETINEFLELFDPSVHPQILGILKGEGVTGVVCFENCMLDSSQRGMRTAVIVGPECTFTSIEFCEGKWLNDLPSQRQYARYAYSKE